MNKQYFRNLQKFRLVTLICLGLLFAGGCSVSSTYIRNYYNGPSFMLVAGPYHLESVSVAWRVGEMEKFPQMNNFAQHFALSLKNELTQRGITVVADEQSAKSRILIEPVNIILHDEKPSGSGYVDVVVHDNDTKTDVAKYTRVFFLSGVKRPAQIFATHFVDTSNNLVVWEGGKLEKYRPGFEHEKNKN